MMFLHGTLNCAPSPCWSLSLSLVEVKEEAVVGPAKSQEVVLEEEVKVVARESCQ